MGRRETRRAPGRRSQVSSEDLLLDLLTQPPAVSAPPRKRRWLRAVVLALLLAALLPAAYFGGRTVLALYTIRQNVQAMQLPATPTLHTSVAATARPQQAQAGPARATAPSRRPAGALTPTAPPTPRPTQAIDAVAAPSGPEPTSSAPGPTRTSTPIPLGGVVPAPPSGTPAAGVPWRPLVAQPAIVGAPQADSRAVTVLLLGLDRRPGETDPARTDSVIVARIDPQRKRIALLSLPRDLIVDIPGYGRARINTAGVYGEIYPELGGGLELTRRTVENLLGIAIDYVVQVDFMGFIGAVDAIGGVDIDVEKEIYDPEYPTMDYGYMELHFLPGPQHMDGATALMYARTRHADTDWDRARRQQQVLLAILSRVRAQNTLDQVQSMAALSTALRDYIKTDLPMDRLMSLAWEFRDFAPDRLERYVLDESMVAMYVTPDDPYAEYALPGTIESLVRQLMNGPA
ncbi:MAG TPA: LCP family protein [Roseiflexaceae bacterium]